MRIAYLTQEFPPQAGGIGSYVYEAARAMAAVGHHVEVFTPDAEDVRSEFCDGFLLHRLGPLSQTDTLPRLLARAVIHRHGLLPFDVLESPEFLAQAEVIRQCLPELPLVVKLHTCTWLLNKLNIVQPPWIEKLRFCLGAWRRMQRPSPYWWRYDPEQDPERALSRSADLVVSPSRAMLRIMRRRWSLNPSRCWHIPNPYQPSPHLLALPVDRPGSRLAYFGRLERRKGVLDLAAALPRVLEAWPQATMQFVGTAMDSPDPSLHMAAYLQQQLRPWQDRVFFLPAIARDRLHEVLAESDICIFPSLWENFPNACLEAMAAGQTVIGSRAGGMAEMIEHGRSGLLVPPRAPGPLAAAVNVVLANPTRQVQMRRCARARILQNFSPSEVAGRMESSYRIAAANALQR